MQGTATGAQGKQERLQQAQRFMQERELWFPCGAHRMRYLRLFPADPEPLPAVVFVHGLMGCSFSWRHNLEFFARHREVYAVDLLGIGDSDRPAAGEADFGLAAAASRLLDFMHCFGRSQVDLVATSHGAAVAMLAASQDRSSRRPIIRRLALIAPAHPYMSNACVNLEMFRNPYGRMLLRGLVSYGVGVQGQAMGVMYADESRITPETLAGYAVNFDDARSYEYATEVVLRWEEDMQELESALSSIAAIPVLLLWGADDPTVPASSGPRLQECFDDAQSVVLPGVGHLPYEEAPGEFNRHLLDFLDR